MNTIKTVQPYKLYIKLFSAKRGVQTAFLLAIVILILIGIRAPGLIILLGAFIIIAFPVMFYNSKLSPQYEPGKTYSFVRKISTKEYSHASDIPSYSINLAKNLLNISNFIQKYITYFFLGIGVIIDITSRSFPGGTLLMGCFGWGMKFLGKKTIEGDIRVEKFRQENHENIDYNVQIDLYDIYGVDDKMILSYQNFQIDQEHLERGDYMLGVSPRGIYFVNKLESVSKVFIRFDEIDTLGLLETIGNLFVFNIKSKNNIEISIIVNKGDSFVVSPEMLIATLLESLDLFLLGDAEANTAAKRRRITVSTSTTESTNVKTEENSTDSCRSLEKKTEVDSTKKSTKKGHRIIDISFTQSLTSELSNGELITSNRIIDIF